MGARGCVRPSVFGSVTGASSSIRTTDASRRPHGARPASPTRRLGAGGAGGAGGQRPPRVAGLRAAGPRAGAGSVVPDHRGGRVGGSRWGGRGAEGPAPQRTAAP